MGKRPSGEKTGRGKDLADKKRRGKDRGEKDLAPNLEPSKLRNRIVR